MPDHTDKFDLPPRVASAINAAFSHHVEIPASIDIRISQLANERFESRRRTRMTLRWAAGLAAGLAAVIVVAISLHQPPALKSVVKGDVNADGQLNIVDALALAKHIAAQDALDKTWDINGDGKIDQKDVDAIAAGSVSLKQGGLARGGLPKLDDLGICRVGSALADVSSHRRAGTFAKANRTTQDAEGRQ